MARNGIIGYVSCIIIAIYLRNCKNRSQVKKKQKKQKKEKEEKDGVNDGVSHGVMHLETE